MAIIRKITEPGNALIGSLSGRIVLDEGRGRIVVTEKSGIEKAVQDISGFHFFDDNKVERSRLGELGLTTIRDDGTHANRVGQAQSDKRDGIWSAKPGVDLRDEGI